MLRGIDTAAAGMIREQRKHDTITNNIANINTPGFKQGDSVARSFPEVMIALMNGTAGQNNAISIGKLNTGVFAEENVQSYQEGDLIETKKPLDIALSSNIQVPDPNNPAKDLQFDSSGKIIMPDGSKIFQPQAFFTVQDKNGNTRYTRNGSFQADENGMLTTADGYKVLGRDGQPIVLVDPTTNEFLPNVQIRSDGQVIDEVNGQPLLNANGQPVSLMISRVNNPNRLLLEGDGVYKINQADQASVTTMVPGSDVQIKQGFIEQSNVDAAQSMVALDSALNAYEANQKVIQYYDQTVDKAVNDVGRVN